jgi:hypothetical protein
MSLLSVNDLPVISASIRMPRVGVASGDLVVDSETDPSGTVTLRTDDGKFSLVGQIFRGGQFVQHGRYRFVAGTGTLDQPVPPKAFDGYTVRSMLVDVLAACGISISKTADERLLTQFMQRWARLGGSGKSAVEVLLRQCGADGWRILPDGTFYATLSEPWPPIESDQFDLISWNRSEGWAIVGSEQPFIFPGQAIKMDDGSIQKISVVNQLIESDSIRALIYFEDQ